MEKNAISNYEILDEGKNFSLVKSENRNRENTSDKSSYEIS